MKAFQVTRYKHPIEAREVPDPVVGEHDLLIEIHAAGVNVLDAKIRDAEFKSILPYKTPFTLGHDLAGVVTEAGPRVTRFKAGDEVYSRPRDGRIGTFAERIAVHEDDVALKPANLTMPEAASAPLVALTAWQVLVEKAQLRSGQKVLVHAGSGGVGTHAIQLAKHLGATVATTTSADNAELVRELGADVVIDYRTQDFESVVAEYDVVLDTQGGETLAKSLRVLKPGGIAVGIAGPPDPAFAEQLGRSFPLRPVMAALSWKTRRAARRLGVRYSFHFMRADGGQLAEIAKLFESGALRPVVERTYPFDDTRSALAHIEGGRTKGKVVIARALDR